MNSSNGDWYSTIDDKDICYMVLAESEYPERHVYAMI